MSLSVSAFSTSHAKGAGRSGGRFVQKCLLVIAVTAIPVMATALNVSSYAFVNDDGTLRIRGRTIHLYGILIPPTDRRGRRSIIPVRCAPRAALALAFKVDSHFVRCDLRVKNRDGSYLGFCRIDDEDLSAYMLAQGWAAALPGAPPLYPVLERIARQKGFGVWGFHADEITIPK